MRSLTGSAERLLAPSPSPIDGNYIVFAFLITIDLLILTIFYVVQQ